MNATTAPWKVLEHGPLETLAPNLWRVEGAIPNMSLRRVMVVARMTDGRLVIHNGIAVDEATLASVLACGTPAFLVVPNGGHRLDAPAWKARFPDLRVVAPRGSRAKVEEKVAVDLACDEFPADDTVSFAKLDGIDDTEAAMLVRSADGVSVVLNDIVFNMDTKKDFLGWLITTIFGSAPGPRVSRLAKFMFVKDKAKIRASLERLADTKDLVRLFVAHEKVASGPAAREALKTAATYLA
ncbi:MAG: hypothetical protein U0169_21890 [Polyangiaceae bacterium]